MPELFDRGDAMNSHHFLGLFLGAVFALVLIAAWYALVALPEVTEYNDHLAAIRESVERCDCASVCERGGPMYLPVESITTAPIDALTFKAVIN
jgi:hypothetical protein